MVSSAGRIARRAAFIPVGLGLIALGISNNNAFIGAGFVFLVIGVASVMRHRRSQKSGSEPD